MYVKAHADEAKKCNDRIFISRLGLAERKRQHRVGGDVLRNRNQSYIATAQR